MSEIEQDLEMVDTSVQIEELVDSEGNLEEQLITSSENEEASAEEEEIKSEEDINLSPETRVGMAIYMQALNNGVVTTSGVLIPNAFSMPQIAALAEVSVNYAIKAMGNIRKKGMIRNRKEDGRILIKLQELEEWLKERGAAVDGDLDEDVEPQSSNEAVDSE